MFRPRAAAFLLSLFLLPACQPRPREVDPRLANPLDLARAAQAQAGGRVFTNPAARTFFAGHGVTLAPADPADSAALLDPAAWRKLDRARRYDAVLLAGPAGQFQPLLAHLAASPDFRLVHADNWGVLFVRGNPAPFVPSSPEQAAEAFSAPPDRAAYLAQSALTFESVGLAAAADRYLAAARAIQPPGADVFVAGAALALHRRNYREALEQAAAARRVDGRNVGAIEIATRAFLAAGAIDQAWAAATELKESAAGDDMNALFLHARVANAARAFSAEQDSLERLVKLADARDLPAGGYRVYLGQSFARQGLARPALEQLEIAAKDPSLTDQQRADLAEAIATVRKRAGDLTP